MISKEGETNLSIKQPVYLPLVDLLNNRLFDIPRYQRPYSWEYKHRSDMFEDIRELQGDSKTVHFMATVVGLCREVKTIDDTEYEFIDVIDGQQRLTTLVILLKTIERKIASLLKDEEWCQKTSKEELARVKRERKKLVNLLVKPADKTLVLLQTNHDSSLYFANYLRKGQLPPASEEVKTLADKELLSAIHDCQREVNRWDDIFELLSITKNQLYFIFYVVANEVSVHKVFEVLNNRGLNVSWMDRFKNRLMKVVFENQAGNRDRHIKELHQIWGTIYETVGLHKGVDTEALRFAATLRGSPVGEPLSEEKAVDRLMYEVGTDAAKTIEISNWVLEVTKALKRVHDEFSPFKDVAMIKIIQVRILATAIFLRKYRAGIERTLLDQCENTSFRIFSICRTFGYSNSKITAKTERGNYLQLAHQITNNSKLSEDEILRRIKKLGERFSFYWENIIGYDCYTEWTDEVRYLLYRYEQHLAEQQGKRFSHTEWNSIWKEAALKSIEHIHPQSKSRQIEMNVHCIGNLLLLPPNINSRLGDKEPEEKAQEYRNTRLLGAEAVAKTIEADGWDDEEIVNRSYEIMEWVNETFND